MWEHQQVTSGSTVELYRITDSSNRSDRQTTKTALISPSPPPLRLSAGGLCLWLILWLVVMKPGRVGACPRLCVCYPTPMTVSCQSQNLTIVPAGVPYDSQRVFLQNNRITELRADSFGFDTQVQTHCILSFQHV